VFKWLAIVFAVALIIVYLIAPIGFGLYATIAPRASVGETPVGFQDVLLATSDNVQLAAWYAPPENGAVIILLHGAGNSRNAVRGHAEMLVNHGYGVLAIDLRGHGESDGNKNLFGWNGNRDIGAAIDFLQKQGDVSTIGGLGLSMGAEALLGSVSEYPALVAVVSDGASYRSLDDYKALPSNRGFFRVYVSWVMYQAVQFFSGDTPPETMLDSMLETDSTAFLLIAAGNVDKEIQYNMLFAEALGERADLWTILGVGHTDGFDYYPEAYEQRVIAFFDQTLLGE
jgi:pimeloyl-ACP methyl ester carboxylesterase